MVRLDARCVGFLLSCLSARQRLFSVRLWRWPFLDLLACAVIVRLYACGVGLSLNSYRSISVAPVRGGTYFLCRRKER